MNENMDVLVQMKSNFDKPEEMANLKRRLPGKRWWGRVRGKIKGCKLIKKEKGGNLCSL